MCALCLGVPTPVVYIGTHAQTRLHDRGSGLTAWTVVRLRKRRSHVTRARERICATTQEEAKRTQLHSSAAALEVRAARAEQQLSETQRQADAARSESRQLAASLASAEARLAEAQQSQVCFTRSRHI